jgi:hypothetical protein
MDFVHRATHEWSRKGVSTLRVSVDFRKWSKN